jgi:hypothetical protein
VLILLITGVLYAGLIWYPRKAAADYARPVSADFAETLAAYRAAVGAFPPGATDASVMIDSAGRMIQAIGPARDALTRSRTGIEEAIIPGIPVISDRPPLDEAHAVQEELSTFYPAALEVVARLERVAAYLAEIGPALASVDEMIPLLTGPVVETGSARKAVAPAAEVVGFLDATAPPEETGGLHSALLAIATEINEDVARLAGIEQPSPVAKAVLGGLRNDLATFRETLGRAGVLVRRAGLGRPIAEAKEAIARVITGLLSLRDEHGLAGVTVPSLDDPAAGVNPDQEQPLVAPQLPQT